MTFSARNGPSLGPLSLRARLLAGLVVLALGLAITAIAITATTRSHLVDQVDTQLIAAASPNRDGGFGLAGVMAGTPLPRADSGMPPEPPERLSTLFEGVIRDGQTLVTLFEPNVPNQSFSPPALDWDTAEGRAGSPFTTESVDGNTEYRVLTSANDATIFVRALALTDVDATVSRLIRLQLLGLLAALMVMSAVAWWVIRLGIAPIQAMTNTATEITESDLSVRVPELSSAGTEAGALATALNTMLGRIEDAVTDQRASEQRLRRFVADASHELRTPVTTIQGYAELYRHGGLSDPADLDDALARTEQEALRMARLVQDMLALAKADEAQPFELRPLDLTALLTDVAADARVTSPHHDIAANIAPGLWVMGDDDRLRQAVTNIVANATRHTPPGSVVTIGAARADTLVQIAVSDDGPGIDAAHIDRLTERFYRVDRSRSRAAGGSGLGLAITSALVTAHDGSLTIESEVGSGTTVTVDLPATATPSSFSC